LSLDEGREFDPAVGFTMIRDRESRHRRLRFYPSTTESGREYRHSSVRVQSALRGSAPFLSTILGEYPFARRRPFAPG
jgi:hypothetical protein